MRFMTVSSTPCCKSVKPRARPESERLAAVGRTMGFLRRCGIIILLGLYVSTTSAQEITVHSAELEQFEGNYYLNADFDFALGETLEDALNRGVRCILSRRFVSGVHAGGGSTKRLLTSSKRVSFHSMHSPANTLSALVRCSSTLTP